jgi:hypothetical protein
MLLDKTRVYSENKDFRVGVDGLRGVQVATIEESWVAICSLFQYNYITALVSG